MRPAGLPLATLCLAVGLAAGVTVARAQTAPAAPTVSSIAFVPASIASGGTTQLSLALGNANATPATLTGALIDRLPSGMTVAGGAGGSCPTAPAAAAGSTTISYPAGASIPAGGCTLTVTVKATTTANRTYYTDTIAAGALQTNDGASPGVASATLTVQSAVNVPNVVGLSQTQATTALQAAGLTLGAITHAAGPAGVPFNSVFAQTPVAATSVTAGSAVSITISTGPGKATNLNNPLTSVAGFVDPSQLSIASALERVCAQLQTPGQTLDAAQRSLLANCLAVLGTFGGGSNGAGLKNTLDALSGKTATAQQSTAIQFAGAQFTNIGTRLAQLRQGTGNPSFAGLDVGIPELGNFSPLLAMIQDITGIQGIDARGSDGGRGSGSGGGGGSGDSEGAGRFLDRLGFFINGDIRHGTQDTTDLTTGFDFRQTSVTAGVDYRVADWLVLGLSYGHANGNTDFAGGTGRLDGNNNSGSIYGTFYDKDLYVDFIGTYGHIGYRATRTSTFTVDSTSTTMPANCNASGVCTIDTVGSTGGRQLAFATSVGYGFHSGALTFGPDVALDYTGIHVNGFTENDPNQTGLALAYDPESGESLLFKAGGNASYAISTRVGVLLPEVRAHWVHEFANNQRTLTAHFADDPSASLLSGPVSRFEVFTDQPDRNYLDWAAGLSAQFPYGISAFVDYSAVGAETDIRTSELAFGVRVRYGY